MKEAIVLFSGGIDSTTALYWALAHYEKVFPLTFDYGQRHRVEIALGKRLVRKLSLSQTILKIDLTQIGGSSLTDRSIPLPQYKDLKEIKKGLPSTYVPFRNGIFLALSAAWAQARGVREIVCGFNIIDSPHYPDTRKDFVRAMERAINQGTRISTRGAGVKIIAPFVDNKKSEIIRKGLSLGADYSYSISCYWGKEVPCLKCSSCLLRQKAWQEVGLEDPLLLRLKKEGKL